MPEGERKPEEIVAKLSPVDVLSPQGRPVAEARAARHIAACCPALTHGRKAHHASDSIRAT